MLLSRVPTPEPISGAAVRQRRVIWTSRRSKRLFAYPRNGRGLVAEFNALQGIISALAFRSHVIDDDLYSPEFYMWYLQKLIDNRNEIVEHRNEAGPPYVLGSDWPERMTVEAIDAILDCVPEVFFRRVTRGGSSQAG